ncbi:MAG TPA: mechanosensitive ion channel domain-containing protein [Polyangia bacterium]
MNISDMLGRLRDHLRLSSLFVLVWIVGALAVGRLLSWLSARLLARLGKRGSHLRSPQVIVRLSRPLTICWAVLAAYVGLPALALTHAGIELARHFLMIAFVVGLFWVLLRAIDVADHVVGASDWASKRAASRSLIALGVRAAKIAIVLLGGVTIVSQAGYPVGSLIAGLGIGGLALALGAQKTLENVFAAFAMALDEPFRLGDFVSVDQVLGNVESIGLRSTRIRTLDRTVVAIPNGKLAEMRTESFAARDRLRFACTVKLVYQTTAAQVRQVLAGLEQVLRAQPKLWTDAVGVRLKELGPSSLDIEVNAWFATIDWGEFQLIREEVLLRFMDVVERAGTTLAYHTQTVHVASTTPAPQERPPFRPGDGS